MVTVRAARVGDMPNVFVMTIYSSIRGLLTAYSGPAVVTGIGILGMVTRGVSPVSALIVIVGGIILLGTLYDYPRRTRFTDEGMVRTTALRRHNLAWSSIDQIERANPLLIGRRFLQSSNDDSKPTPPRAAGLVAVRGRQRFLLTNAREGRDEFDQLFEIITRAAPDVVVLASRPPIDAAPSNLYRRHS
jgi:hypothetical protein